MKMTKRAAAMLLTLAMCLGLLAGTAMAADPSMSYKLWTDPLPQKFQEMLQDDHHATFSMDRAVIYEITITDLPPWAEGLEYRFTLPYPDGTDPEECEFNISCYELDSATPQICGQSGDEFIVEKADGVEIVFSTDGGIWLKHFICAFAWDVQGTSQEPSSEPQSGNQAGWQKDSVGWRYRNSDGGYPVKKWQNIDGKWYYFGAEGYMQTGWQQIGKTWYYFQSSGAMATDWQKIGKTWYYFQSSGAMSIGWQQIGKSWYYFQSSGAMVTGWQQIGNAWYYFRSSGAMATGWLKDGKAWYYFDASGTMAVGWRHIGGTWYYFKSSGAMAANEYVGSYWVDASGAWIP